VNSLNEAIKYFLVIMAELSILFLGISAIIALAFMYIPRNKINRWIAGKGLWGNVMGVLFGAVTPFCACSTVPMTLGFLQAGVPFGAVMSFVVSSPLMDPLIFPCWSLFWDGKSPWDFFS
jgi:Predicted permeases